MVASGRALQHIIKLGGNGGVLIPFDLLAHQTTALRIKRLKWIVELSNNTKEVRTYDRHDEGILLEVIGR